MNIEITLSKEELEKILTDHFKESIPRLKEIRIIKSSLQSGATREIALYAILEKEE